MQLRQEGQRRLYQGKFYHAYQGDFTKGTLPRGLYQGDFTKGILPRGLYQGDFTKGTLPRGLYQGDFTKGTLPCFVSVRQDLVQAQHDICVCRAEQRNAIGNKS